MGTNVNTHVNSHAFGDSDVAKQLLEPQSSNSSGHCPFMPVFGAPQVMFVRGQGTELWDASGKHYLDFLSGISVTSLGHSHPVVTAAISEQAATLMHVSNFFTNPVATEAAVMVDKLLGGGGQVFFCNSGAESIEAAIKLARKFGGRGRHTVVSALGSFHGRTLAALAATGQPAKHELDAAVDGSVAAVLLESVQGEGGVIPASIEYLQAVSALCVKRGVLLMMDEVQTGFARTGQWFGFEHAGIKPDVVTLAKAMGNGMPIGAVWARKEVASVFQPGDHGSTFSGTAIATAAARATIKVMLEMDAPAQARAKGKMLSDALSKLPQVVEIRGRGLLLGVELQSGIDAKTAQSMLLDRGLVTNAVTASALRLAPPITVLDSEIATAVELITSVLAEIASKS
jgi:acetylornithine/succinyldiaminopimelate/putrescine aminotransferase